jgi:torulene dioxygenase
MLYLDHMRITDPTGKSIETRRYILSNIQSSSSSSNPLTIPSIPTHPAKPILKFSNIKLPTPHPNPYSSQHRYIYGTHRAKQHAPGVFTDNLIKLDMDIPKLKRLGVLRGIPPVNRFSSLDQDQVIIIIMLVVNMKKMMV